MRNDRHGYLNDDGGLFKHCRVQAGQADLTRPDDPSNENATAVRLRHDDEDARCRSDDWLEPNYDVGESRSSRGFRPARATNSSIVMQLRGKGELPAVDGFEVDDSGVTAEVENVLSDSEVASAATLLA